MLDPQIAKPLQQERQRKSKINYKKKMTLVSRKRKSFRFRECARVPRAVCS